MNIVMPLAGRGTSFLSQGIDTPKPLIQILGKPMILWATDALNFVSDPTFIFIVRDEHIKKYKIDKELKKLYKGSRVEIINTDGITEGAACTVLQAKELINNDSELIIYNPDQYFKSNLKEILQKKDENIKGVIPVFYATHPRWSYVQVDKEGVVIQVREKEQISTKATVGLYYFTHGKDFVWAAEKMISKNIRIINEFYVSPTYNQLIERGDRIVTSECISMWGMGTPEEVKRFEKYYKEGRY